MKSSNIGGQAVLEGIMMKNRDHYAVAVRKPDGEIFVQTEEFHSVTGRYKKLTTIPFVRGVFNFIDSMVLGIKTLTFSASFYEEEEEKNFSEAEQKKKEKQESLLMAGTVAFSIVAAVAIFMVLPYFLSSLMKPVVPSYHLRTVIEGFVRIGIFIIYILLISRMEDIQRTFMYHGAEHKCINCIEHGLPHGRKCKEQFQTAQTLWYKLPVFRACDQYYSAAPDPGRVTAYESGCAYRAASGDRRCFL